MMTEMFSSLPRVLRDTGKQIKRATPFPKPPALRPLPRACRPHSPVHLQGNSRASPWSRAAPPTSCCGEGAGDVRGYLHCTSRVASCLSSPTALLATHVYVPESWRRVEGRDSTRPPERICASPGPRKAQMNTKPGELPASWLQVSTQEQGWGGISLP